MPTTQPKRLFKKGDLVLFDLDCHSKPTQQDWVAGIVLEDEDPNQQKWHDCVYTHLFKKSEARASWCHRSRMKLINAC